MGRLIIGDLTPVMAPDPNAKPFTPKGVAGAVDKWGKILKLGNDIVSSNLGKGLMDVAGAAVSDVGERFGDLNAVLDARKADELARAAREASGMPEPSGPDDLMPSAAPTPTPAKPAFGGPKTIIPPAVPAASVDARMAEIARLRAQGLGNRQLDKMESDLMALRAATPEVYAQPMSDEVQQAAMVQPKLPRGDANGDGIPDQIYFRMQNEELDSLTPATRVQYDRALLAISNPRLYSPKAVRAAQAYVQQIHKGVDKTIRDKFFDSSREMESGEPTLTRPEAAPAVEAPVAAPSGAMPPPLPGMTVQSVTNRPGGEEGVYYPKDYAGPMPPAKAPSSPATPAEAPAAMDAFDAAYAKFDASKPAVVTQDPTHPMAPYTVQRAQTPSSDDIQSLAAMADTPEKQAKVLDLIDRRPFKPSSIFDFTGGGETARFTESVRKLFPKSTELTEYQRLSLQEKMAGRQSAAEAKKATAERLDKKLAFDKKKWDEWKALKEAEIRAKKKAAGRGGDPLRGAKAVDQVLGDVEKGADDEIKKIEKDLSELDSETKKLQREAERAAAASGYTPGKEPGYNLSAPKKADEDDLEGMKEYQRQKNAYDEKLAKQREAQVIHEQAKAAAAKKEEYKKEADPRLNDAKKTKDSAKAQRAENRKKFPIPTGGK